MKLQICAAYFASELFHLFFLQPNVTNLSSSPIIISPTMQQPLPSSVLPLSVFFNGALHKA